MKLLFWVGQYKSWALISEKQWNVRDTLLCSTPEHNYLKESEWSVTDKKQVEGMK